MNMVILLNILRG